jgi:hypothetical protein
MFAEPRFHARDQHFEILVARGILEAGDEGLIGQAGRAVDKIEAECCDRQRHRESHRQGFCRRMGWGEFGALLFRIGGEQPAGNFDAGGLGVPFPDQAALPVAFNLTELIAIDSGVEGGAWLLRCASTRKRAEHDVEHESRQNGKDQPEQHLGRTSACQGG